MKEDLVVVVRWRSPGAKARRKAKGLMSRAVGSLMRVIVDDLEGWGVEKVGSQEMFGVERRARRLGSRCSSVSSLPLRAVSRCAISACRRVSWVLRSSRILRFMMNSSATPDSFPG